MPEIIFKRATTDEEFDQVHALNYRTFVEEIPQHPPNAERRLVDKFHGQNTYIIALDGDRLDGDQVVGMITYRGARPFSLDAKLADLDAHIPAEYAHLRPCEVRLLAVDPAYRQGRVLANLIYHCVKRGMEEGFGLTLISGTVTQLSLYKRMGFEAFGPLVGSDDAQYQPMMMPKPVFEAKLAATVAKAAKGAGALVNLMTGPVALSPAVQKAAASPAISHRSIAFDAVFQQVRQGLCALTQADKVVIANGSGTMANDMIAAHLSRLQEQRGLVLTAGEFGNRLVDQARRHGLSFGAQEWSPNGFDKPDFLDGIDWLWTPHCETSTGRLMPLERLKEICRQTGTKLCLDCVSTLGAVPLDLRGVYAASASSGKGMGAPAGLAIVLHNQALVDDFSNAKALPAFLDLSLYHDKGGVPFTLPSGLVLALEAALKERDAKHFARLATLSRWLHEELAERNIMPLIPASEASPAVMTLAVKNSEQLADNLEQNGFRVSFESTYLRRANHIQIALFGEVKQAALFGLADALVR